MWKAIAASFLCGLLVGVPVLVGADGVSVTANILPNEVLLELNPTAIDFGDLYQGQTSSVQTVEVRNGSAVTPLRVSVEPTGDTSLLGDPSSDPTRVGLYYMEDNGTFTRFPVQAGAYLFYPEKLVSPDSSVNFAFRVRVGRAVDPGPIAFNLEFRADPDPDAK